jgi:hypothetical protein
MMLMISVRPSQAERKPVALGLLGGINGASFWGKEIKEFDMTVWPTTGFSLAFHLPVFLGAEVDLIYASKGGSYRTYPAGELKVNTIKAHYLQVPMMIKITAPTGNEVLPIFFGGPSYNRLISKDSYSDIIGSGGGGLVTPKDAEPPIKKENLVDEEWSLTLGGGVEWGLGSFQLRFNFARESLDKTKQVDLKTFEVAVMAGFIF